jgi:predicted RecA/RadA family phage recombinase
VKNQVYTGTPTSRRFALCPSTVVAGQAVLLGAEPAVALDDYNSGLGGTTFLTGGSFNLTVVGATGSPATSHSIAPGAKLYADGGTVDVTTNVRTGFTINGNPSADFFGYLDPNYQTTISSGATDTAAIVRLGGAE